MVKHNNVIPNGHFKKHWQNYVKTWFNQPARITRRRNGTKLRKLVLNFFIFKLLSFFAFTTTGSTVWGKSEASCMKVDSNRDVSSSESGGGGGLVIGTLRRHMHFDRWF